MSCLSRKFPDEPLLPDDTYPHLRCTTKYVYPIRRKTIESKIAVIQNATTGNPSQFQIGATTRPFHPTLAINAPDTARIHRTKFNLFNDPRRLAQ